MTIQAHRHPPEPRHLRFSGPWRSVSRPGRAGLVLPMVLIVGSILLVFGVTLHRFVGQQNANVHMIAAGEVAHFLAEAGISSCVRSVRESLQEAGLLEGSNSKVRELLTKPQPLEDTSLMPFLKDTWNAELAGYAKEVDKTAKIRVEVWLRGFQQTEGDPAKWVDPGAKAGWLSIEAAGEFKGVRRVLVVKRKVWVGNVLPPVVSKFTLHLRDANRGNAGAYNIIRNDYASNVTDGPKPFICLNHTTPSEFFPFPGKAISAIEAEEKDPQVYQKRGWIWLGGGQVRLNITSGSGEFGEIFHFYDISTSNSFQPIKFKTPQDKLPARFSQVPPLPWDLLEANNPASQRNITYTFGHSFVLEGFHDKSNRREHDALYERSILSRTNELPKYGSKSNMLHLYGLAKLGFQSRTKIFGEVMAAFPRFATLEVKPEDADVQSRFAQATPPPIYLLPSLGPADYREIHPITDFLSRRLGGPFLGTGILFENQEEYARFMSCIVEAPFNTSYNAIQDAAENISPRPFPPSRTILQEDLGTELCLKRDHLEIYKGNVSADSAQDVVLSRVQRVIGSVEEFWKTFFDEQKKELILNEIILLENPAGETFLLPPSHLAYPLKVSGGGMIILANGNLTLRGVQMQSPNEALTVVVSQGTSVHFETPQMNQVNILAPRAELSYSAPAEVLGTVALRSIIPDSRTGGGVFRFREDQDPTQDGYYRFYKVRINSQDTFWHE